MFLINNTGSMMGRGHGLGDTIWFDVLDCIVGFVNSIPLNTVLVVFEFDHTLHGPEVFYLSSDEHKQKAINHITNFSPDRQHAFINDVLYSVIDFLKNNYSENCKSIYLIAGGYSSSRRSFREVIESFDDLSGYVNHLYYIDLRGRAIHDIIQEAAINPRFSLLRDCSEMIK